ncbi:hypothetical protein AB0L13_33825 [Saccharopolyspora shandongensis]
MAGNGDRTIGLLNHRRAYCAAVMAVNGGLLADLNLDLGPLGPLLPRD